MSSNRYAVLLCSGPAMTSQTRRMAHEYSLHVSREAGIVDLPEFDEESFWYATRQIELPLLREHYLAGDGHPPGPKSESREIVLKAFPNWKENARNGATAYHLWDEGFDETAISFELTRLSSNPDETHLKMSMGFVLCDETSEARPDPCWLGRRTLDELWLSEEGLARWAMALLRWPGRHVDYAVSFARFELEAACIDEPRSKQRAEDMLRDELHRFCWELSSSLELTPEAAAARHNGNLALSCALFDALRSIGAEGTACALELARQEQQDVQEGWQGWGTWFHIAECSKGYDNRIKSWYRIQSQALALITAALWADRVRARWERECRHRPALSRGVLSPVLDIKRARFDERGQAVTEGRLIATHSPTIPAALARVLAREQGLEKLWGSVYAHRLINHLAITTHEAKERGTPDHRLVIFEGGWTGLREALGYANSKNDELRHLIDAGQYLHFEDHRGSIKGLWTCLEIKATRGRKAQLRLVVGEALLPNFNERYSAKTLGDREARQLIPILEHEPPLSALRNNEHGAALALCWLALIELREHADELYSQGAIKTSEQRWEELARRAGLPTVSLNALLTSWAQGDTAPQLIERQGDQWTLSDAHWLARDFIKEAGQMMSEGRVNGRKRKTLKRDKHIM